jgi:hypothetical protein
MFVGHNGRRSGTRGGRDQFSWEDVKADKKTRENYIGHSLHTSSVPSFNDPKPNPMWYLKRDGADEQEEAANELQRLKQLEQEMMLEALGLKPRGSTSAAAAAAAATKRPLKPHELGDVLKRGQTASAAEPGDDNASAAAGLGAKSGSRANHGAMGAFGVPEAIEGVDLPDEHWQRVHEQRRRERDQKAPIDAPQRRREESPARRRKKSKKRHEHKKRSGSSKKRRSSISRSSSSSDSSDSSDSDPRRRRRRHDSDSDSGGGRRRRRHDSDSERSRSRSPRRRHS